MVDATRFACLVAGLFVVGCVAGVWFRTLDDAWRATLRKAGALLVGAMVAVPVALILLAKLFGSDTLGWMFGLTMMLGVALVPCAVVLLAGARIGSFFGRRGRSAASTLTVSIERDSVHASDDEDLARTIVAASKQRMTSLVERVIADGFLPRIHGGEATWVIESTGRVGQPIGFCAQQWSKPVLAAGADTSVGRHFYGIDRRLRFVYRCQANPADVVKRIAAHPRSTPRNQ